uniref:protein-tyrosine-phosphatase n=1 Tax=Globisporangium ultimum (strain ATCC 200006 / CBS 805.95 / DAOM BR144) TaxID=431595 RepID=K3X8B0_GLOUD
MDVVEAIEARQKTHPPVAGLPRTATIHGLPLFIGDANAAADGALLREHKIAAVVSLGTGDIAAKPSTVHCVDILDMEEELILPFFDECIQFIHKAIHEHHTSVLVHCVYGQSRSATICVAYLMATLHMSLLEAYDAVQRARPCVYINSGFLRQLKLFERMGAVADHMGDTPAHAEFRTMVVAKQRRDTGMATAILGAPQLEAPRRTLHCRKCNYVLASTGNELLHGKNSSGLCSGAIFIEPMQWMVGKAQADAFVRVKEGKLACPSCNAKIGSWNWIGVKCQCRYFVSPAFQLVPSRTEYRGQLR